MSPNTNFPLHLKKLDPKQPQYVTDLVDLLLAEARASGASDLHLNPAPDVLDIRWRLDGVLHDVVRLPASLAPNLVARLKVLADLLTYRNDVPQEGRIRATPGELETRVSTFPTLHGERACRPPLRRPHPLPHPPRPPASARPPGPPPASPPRNLRRDRPGRPRRQRQNHDSLRLPPRPRRPSPPAAAPSPLSKTPSRSPSLASPNPR